MKSSLSVPRFLVDQALTRKGTNLADFIDGGRKQGKTIEEIHPDLLAATGVDFTVRTLYRWVEKLPQLEPVANGSRAGERTTSTKGDQRGK